MYGLQSEILICGKGIFFLLDTVFIAQSRIFALLSVSSRILTPRDSRSVLLFIISKLIKRKLFLQCPRLFIQLLSLKSMLAYSALSLSLKVAFHSMSLFSMTSFHSSSLFLNASSKLWSLLLSSASNYSSLS